MLIGKRLFVSLVISCDVKYWAAASRRYLLREVEVCCVHAYCKCSASFYFCKLAVIGVYNADLFELRGVCHTVVLRPLV